LYGQHDVGKFRVDVAFIHAGPLCRDLVLLVLLRDVDGRHSTHAGEPTQERVDVEHTASEWAAPACPRKLLEHAIELTAHTGERRPFSGSTLNCSFFGFDRCFLRGFSHDASSSWGFRKTS